MRTLIGAIKEESELHFSLAVVLRDYLKRTEDTAIEHNIATILEDKLASNTMFARMESLIDDLEQSLTA